MSLKLPQFITRWLDPDGHPGQTMPDTDHEAQAKWAAAMNKMRPESHHRVEEWQPVDNRRNQ